MSKYNKKNFLQQKKEEKQNRELTKKKIDMASKIYLFYKNGKICQQLLESLIAVNQQKIRPVLTSKSTLEQNVYNKVCNLLLNKYPEILKPFQLLNKKNAQNYEEYIIGMLEIFATSLQLKQSSFIIKSFSNVENLIYRLHFLKAILLVFVLLKNSPNQVSLLTITNEILLKVDNFFNNNDKKTFFKYFKILNTKIVEECMNQILKYEGFQIFLHSYLEKQNNDGANNLAFQFLLITNELRKEYSTLMQMVLQSSQFNQLLQNQFISDLDLEKINILFQKIVVNNYQVNESYFQLVTKLLIFLEEQFFRKEMLSQYKATLDQKVSDSKKLKNLRKNQIYETFLESINLPQLINIATNFQGENIVPLCCYFYYLQQLGIKKNKDIRFQQLFQQVSKFDYNFKYHILKFSLDNNYGIPFEFLTVYCSYKVNELQLMDDQEFKSTYLATEKEKQELNQIFEYIVKFARNFIANQQYEKLPKNIIIYIKEVYQRNEVLQFSQWKYENTKLNYSLPFLTEFSYRIDEFNKYLEDDKKNYSRNLEDLFTVNMDGEPVIKQSRLIIIKRGEEFQDAYDQLFNQQLKNLYHIKFFNQYGMLEDGIDGGGLTKEFLIRFVNQAFDPNFGLFIETPERTIIPNPAFMQQDLSKYEFVGKMIGKAIYEGILIEKVLCSIFLNQVLNVSNTIHDFRYFDSAQYQRIFNLKNQDVTDFGLTFSITENFYDQIVEFDLIKNGRNIPVTNQNKLQYIKLYSDFRLNQQIKKQSQYFKKGLEEVIDSEKLKLFTNQELQLLISGQPVIDLVDLISNTHYKGYTPFDQTIKDFWDVLNEMEYTQQTQFLFFFTSCSRAPTQGFKSLDPPFQIQKIPINNQQDLQKLPTSSTCFNILKLPDYKNKALLKQKLIKAITSNSGLELT